MRGDLDLVLDTGEGAELGLDHDAVVMCVLDNLLRDLDIFGKGLGGGVDHHGGEAVLNAGLAQLEAVAVVQVQGDGQAGLDDGGLHQLLQIGAVGIGPGALGHLQDQGASARQRPR